MGHLGWTESLVIGGLQGVAELFPVSSLGHSVLLPALIGGSWARDLSVSAPESPYLAFIVGLHVATAAALVVFFWRDWLRLGRGFLTSVLRREVADPDQRLAWLLILATIPVGLAGLALEHLFRTTLSRPVPTAAFLALNGAVLLAVERLPRWRAGGRPRGGGAGGEGAGEEPVYIDERISGAESDRRLARLPVGRAVLVGTAQVAALAPGVSRSGVTMATGLLRGLSHEDAARFAFLLSTPVIAAAGVLKLGDLAGPLGAGIRGQVLAASVLSGLGAYASVRFLTRYFATRSLRPFGIYCLVAGVACLAWFTLR